MIKRYDGYWLNESSDGKFVKYNEHKKVLSLHQDCYNDINNLLYDAERGSYDRLVRIYGLKTTIDRLHLIIGVELCAIVALLLNAFLG